MITKTIGNLIRIGGTHTSQIIESNIDSLFDKFSNEQSFKFENTKFALMSLLKEYTKNSPVIVYTKIIENFDLFLKIVDNYKDPRSFIREATQELVEEFLKLLSNRDYKIREEYTSKIFSRIEKNFDTGDSNIIHGIILILKACTIRREFFNEKYKKGLEFLNKHKNHKNQSIRILIFEHLPYFAEYLVQVFESSYFETFMTNMIQTLNSKPTPEIKSQLFITLGKLSVICSKDKFLIYVQHLMKVIKLEFEKNALNLSLTLFDCMANLLKRYKSYVLGAISYEDILVKMFNCGFYDSHCQYLTQLINSFEENSIDRIKIIIVVLNVISIIISDRKFYLKDSYNHLKNLHMDMDVTQGSLMHAQSFISNGNGKDISMRLVGSDGSRDYEEDRYQRKPSAILMIGNKEFLNHSRKAIIYYIVNTKSNNKIDFNRIMAILIRNALNFLKQINHSFFAKDILTFYQQYCLKFLEQNDNLIKETAINLATAPWIPKGDQKIDYDIEYIVNIILDSYINLILNEQNDDIKLKMISQLDERYDKFLATNKFFNKLTLALNFSDNNLREKVVQVIGRILHDNYTTIILFIKSKVFDIFTTLDMSPKLSEKEDAIILLNYYVKYAGGYILDYVELIFSNLIKILKSNNVINNDVLNVSILSIVSELVSNSNNRNGMVVKEEYFKEILVICIENLKDFSSLIKQEISLKTILSILEHSEIEWKIYFDYPELINILIQILIKEYHKNSRLSALRIFGFIGAMDPEKLEKIWSIHKIENNFIHENYEIDEYNNYDDEDIIAHQRLHMIKSDKDINVKLSRNNKKKLPDFQKMIIDQELDPCTYHAVRALMNILKDNSQPEPSIQVIGILGSLLKSLQESDHPVVELILPTLLETIEDFETNYTKAIFDHILIILNNFKNNFKHYLKEVLDVLVKYIKEKEFQGLVFSILTKMLEEFLEDMEIYFPRLVPLLLSILDENRKCEKNISNVQKYVFNCLSLMSEKLSNYLSIIIPEVINLLSQPITFSLPPQNLMEIQTVRTNSKGKDQITIEDSRSKDDDVFFFLDKIIRLPNFSQYLPKTVNALLKYLESSFYSYDKIMQLFLVMNEKLRSDFLIFLPMIIRTTRNLGINLAPYFGEIKSSLDKDEIVEEIKNRNCEINRVSTIKRKRTGSHNSNYYDNRENINKTRKSQIDKDLLVREFDPVNCSIEEDWLEWFKSTSKILFEQSPSYALYYCHNVADYYTPLLTELYNYAFISCWRNLNDYHKMSIISYLNTALTSAKTPNEILLTILNLAEFIEREENHIDFIDFGRLGYVADVCKAYAKALYYKENDFRNNNDFNTLEQLIALYYELKLPEAAIGILKMAQHNNKIINEDDWYLKLHKWNDALEVYNNKLKTDPTNSDLIKGKFICLDGLCDWESMINLADDVEKEGKEHNSVHDNIENNQTLITKMSPSIAKASLNLNDWDKLKYYIEKIDPEDDEEEYEKTFFQAVLSIKEENYQSARAFIEKARNIVDDKIKTLLSESYGRAYKLLLENQHLYELEEIICMNTDSNSLNRKITKDKLKIKWDDRLEIVDEDIKTYDRILAIRGLVFSLSDDYDKHLQLAKICRNEDRFSNCLNVLNRLNRRLGQYEKQVKIKVELNINKCLYENNMQDQAINNLKQIINEEINYVDDILKSKIYCYYGIWNLQKNENNLKEETVKSIMGYLELSQKFDQKNYYSWHNYALVNYKFFDFLINSGKESKNSNSLFQYATNAINGFMHAVCIGGKNISKTLQDLLRLIDLWFNMGDKEEIDKLIHKAFEMIDLDSWLLVIPQLLARVNIIDERIKNSLSFLLRKIGNTHPRALLYPLIVMNKSRSRKRRLASQVILDEMKKKYSTLIDEGSLIIDELNRCALLLHEEWGEAIEESAKLYFQSNDIKGMIKILMEVHEKMSKKPETMNEIHFYQLYASDLSEAESYLKRYIETLNEMDLKQAWDIYHSVFKSMNEAFTDLKYLDLENVSPKLHNFKESQICVPGLYKSGYPVIKITGFEKQLTVFSSKQHPRRLIIYGSDGKEHMFLLKGHEDLRQDERAMQLFGLVNTLLSTDNDTETKNLFIKRFPVIPLSHNTGIIGWVPNCDTLHQLIKEYRTTNKIIQNVEHRLIFTICPKFETAAFLNKLEVFKYALQNTLGLDLYKILWKKSKNSEAWLDRRTNYSRSLAVMSMVGYILGLGDRHPSNLMLDRNSGKIIHIDFGDCFEVAMKRERFPERVPFRLTRMLIKALEVSGIEGTFRITCEHVMRVLRANKDSLIAILTAFVHDPLISFRLLIPLILKATKGRRHLATEEKITSESLRNDRPDEIKAIKTKSLNPQPKLKIDFEAPDVFDESEPRRRKMGSTERQLYNMFEERGKKFFVFKY